MLRWNKALWLAVTSPMVIFNQSECFISVKHSYATLKFVYDIHSAQNKFWPKFFPKTCGNLFLSMSTDDSSIRLGYFPSLR